LSSLTLGVFLRLAEDVWERESFAFDQTVLNSLFAARSAILTAIMQTATVSGSAPFVVVAMAFLGLLWWRHARANVWAIVVAVGGGVGLNEFLKALFARPRPTLHPALTTAVGWSFPSGHSTTALVFYGVVAYLIARRLHGPSRWLVYIFFAGWIGLVGLSRNYLGVHYPSDVIAAYAVTLPWLLGVIGLHRCLTAPEPPNSPQEAIGAMGLGEAPEPPPGTNNT
jgi:membrane-associated phospholipid phosphatase